MSEDQIRKSRISRKIVQKHATTVVDTAISVEYLR